MTWEKRGDGALEMNFQFKSEVFEEAGIGWHYRIDNGDNGVVETKQEAMRIVAGTARVRLRQWIESLGGCETCGSPSGPERW